MHPAQRISVGGSLGTVRFVGAVPAWPGVTAVGVEWDDPARGRHSGTLDGVQYFACSVPGAGSFVKATKVDGAVDFATALRAKYTAQADDDDDIAFGSKRAERVGFDKYRARISQLDRLQVAGLDHMCIDASSPGLTALCPELVEVDLSFNLFESLAPVHAICVQLPRLHTLKLAGCRLADLGPAPPAPPPPFVGVETVWLAATLPHAPTLATLPRLFPDAQTCLLGGNALAFASLDFGLWNVTALDLSDNKLTEFPDLRGLPRLRTLLLAHNAIAAAPKAAVVASSLEELDLRHNALASWADVDALAATFAGVTSVRLRWNPVTASVPEREAHTLVIGRWGGRLGLLDGVRVAPAERLDAELYLHHRVNAGTAPMDRTSPRWLELVAAHGAAPEPAARPSMRSSLVQLTLVHGERRLIKTVPRTTPVRRLRVMVARWLSLPADLTLTVAAAGGRPPELMADPIQIVGYYAVDDVVDVFVS
ncbi:uncharacterized protein V1510DRAFT_396906 [Dipodascopsis tothii]|uniref:uncharacterized protein n=1 Tax=Dipodascopsis tothii TaxID=44089 RepID=UPI0034CF92B8